MSGFLQCFTSRFVDFPFNPNQPEPKDTAGYRILAEVEKDTDEKFYIFPQVYIQDVIKGFNEKQANEILLKSGLLVVSKDKGYRYTTRLPHKIDPKRTRCYLLIQTAEFEEEVCKSD
ncbi:hypothetical protein ACFSAV_06535 [Pasteurella oralis]|uniref:Phage protein n=1 Tax=Pasteurella oralis TaxID=1071947 RepID=A0ABW4NTS5_9PAST